MILLPAIDLYEGKVVRLTRGDYGNMTVYRDDPAAQAAEFQAAGAAWLHTVDLEGARDGGTPNFEVIRQICRSTGLKVEIGGGIRSEEAVKNMLSLGVKRVIIGTKAVEEPEFLKDMVEKFGADAIAAGIDAKAGMVAIQGWEQVSTVTATELCLKMKEYGVKHIIYTDISRDGMLSGPNIPATKKLTLETGLDIIASGGVSCMEDLQSLYDAGISGAIIGKALYENRVDLEEAVCRFEK